jgi:predicted transcriptional regulator
LESTEAKRMKPMTEMQEQKADLTQLIMPWDVFSQEKFPPTETYLDPWLQSESIVMISGWRGQGKSLFVMGLLDALTRGGKFGDWNVAKTVPVLWYEGEMQSGLTQRRITQILKDPRGRKELAWILNRSQLVREGGESGLISHVDFRERFQEEIINAGIKVVAFDNLSSLVCDIDENSKKEFDPVNQWLLKLRALGITVIFVHHRGKGGGQRGTSSHEDAIDVSIHLKPVSKKGVGAMFDVEFEKIRSIETSEDWQKISPARRMKLNSDKGYPEWISTVSETSTPDSQTSVLNALGEGWSKNRIIREINVSQKKLDEWIEEFKGKGWLVETEKSKPGIAAKFQVTELGKGYLDEHFIGSVTQE